jgi:RNA polymerase sigma-32 factor
MGRNTQPDRSPIDAYLAEIRRIPLLTIEQEQELARRFRAGDGRAGHQLVAANLRFVVKVAFEYRSYGLRMPDLIQEGNIGLMRAVQKFDPARHIRLVSYAVWWIRAYLQNHILRSWSLVRLGTTQAQRKLFFSLARARRQLAQGGDELGDTGDIAYSLSVKPSEVVEMSARLDRRDQSLDAVLGDDGSSCLGDRLATETPSAHEQLAAAEQRSLIGTGVRAALARLDARERFILEQRLLAEPPMSLRALGDHFGFSRERARQLELRATQRLRLELSGLAAEATGDASPVRPCRAS